MRRATPLLCALLLAALSGAAALAQEPPPAAQDPGTAQPPPEQPPPDQPPPEEPPAPDTTEPGDPPPEPVPTLNSAAMPDVTKLKADVARAKIEAAGIYADFELDYEHPDEPPRGIDVGEVYGQDPPAGQVVESGADDLYGVSLTVYAGPEVEPDDGCEEARPLEKAVERLDQDVAEQILGESEIAVERDFKLVGSGDFEPAVSDVDLDEDRCRAEVDVKLPAGQRAQDLYFVLRPRLKRLTFGDEWALTAGQASFFTIQVIDRAGHLLGGAEVGLDIDDLGGRDVKGRTASDGKTSVKVTPKRAGRFDLVASAIAGNGQTIYGVTRIAVEDRSRDDELVTFLGDRFVKSKGKFRFNRKPGEPGGDERAVCAAFKATTGRADCPAGYRANLTVVVLNNEDPLDDEIGVARTARSEGLEMPPGESTMLTKAGIEIAGVAAAQPEAKAGARGRARARARAVFNTPEFPRNAWAGITAVSPAFAARIPAPVRAKAKAAGELIAAVAPHLSPSIPLAHTIQVGHKGGDPAKPPLGPPAIEAGKVKVTAGPTEGAPAGTEANCDFGATVRSEYAPTFLNVFKKYC